ncbi:MAG TPA: ion channel [Polyangiaceae bacterium]|nr:ion channel [Polyangiaceae bacterium]
MTVLAESSNPPAPGTLRARGYEVRIVGAPRTPLRDFYHALMRLSWPLTIAFVAGGYAAINALFAIGYLLFGGIGNARPGSFADAFYFSVETMGTIGYGYLYPQSPAANLLMTLESTCSLVLTALATGLIFAKFSRPSAALVFSKHVAIAPRNGVPTLAFRLGNLRSNRIVEAQVRVALMRTERTLEGETFYRLLDLPLLRERILSLSRSWTVLHTIDENSPLFGETPQSLAQKDAELLVTIAGTDDIWMQTVHASNRYMHSDLVWGARLSDVLREEGEDVVLDLTRFHDLEPTPATEAFPHSAKLQ